MLVRERTPADRDAVATFLAANHCARVARLGTLAEPMPHPALVAVDGAGTLAGVLTYVVDGPACEILTLHAVTPWQGAGTALYRAPSPPPASTSSPRSPSPAPTRSPFATNWS